MDYSFNDSSGLYALLKQLMQLKSNRDGKNFTTYQLAKAIDMPHSILMKLVHPDPAKRVNNPRLDTLSKIIDYFKSDGFSVTLDGLFNSKKEIDIQSQSITHNNIEKTIQIFSLDSDPSKIGHIKIELPGEHENLIAFLSDDEIKPFFKAGSIFIIDKDISPTDGNLVATEIEKHNKILIRKLSIIGNKKYLVSLDNDTDKIQLLPTTHFTLIGVIVRVHAKT